MDATQWWLDYHLGLPRTEHGSQCWILGQIGHYLAVREVLERSCSQVIPYLPFVPSQEKRGNKCELVVLWCVELVQNSPWYLRLCTYQVFRFIHPRWRSFCSLCTSLAGPRKQTWYCIVGLPPMRCSSLRAGTMSGLFLLCCKDCQTIAWLT